MFQKVGTYLAMSVTLFLFTIATTFAEGQTVCNGKFVGTTELNNPNAGQTYFNSHQSSFSDANRVVDLSIVTGTSEPGLAPAAMEHAACIQETTSSATPFVNKLYEIQGWAWNDNIGFISFFCNGSTNPEVDTNLNNSFSPIACGTEDYGVTIGAEVAGVRQLRGYAWNEVFGYLNFSCQGGVDGSGNACGAISYGVTADSAGNLSGYAWSEAGIWVDFSGAQVILDEQPGIIGEGYCDDLTARPLCMTVDPDPNDYIGIDALGTAKIADGVDYYQIDLYLMEADGVTPLDIAADNVSIDFVWRDTVKANQLEGQTGNYSDVEASAGAGIVYKPQLVNSSNFSTIFEQVMPGHYRLKDGKRITAVAPTSNENVSLTTSTEPAFVFSNERFFTEVPNVTDEEIQPNELELQYIQVSIGGVQQAPIYPNGMDGVDFRFRPAVSLDTLYANDFEDSIMGVRGIPTSYAVKAKEVGNLGTSSKTMRLYMAYDPDATEDENGCQESGGNFALTFLKDLAGTTYDPGAGPTNLSAAVSALQNEIEISSVATLDAEGENPCNQAQGPTIYSRVNYVVTLNGIQHRVYYYSNKLPRIASSVANQVVLVHGNIYAPNAVSPSSEQVVQESGDVQVSGIRDIITQNITKKLPNLTLNPSSGGATGGTCTVSWLRDAGRISVQTANGCTSADYTVAQVDQQNVIYFNNVDVVLNLSRGSLEDWSVVVVGGNVFVEDDVQGATSEENLALITIAPFSAGCHNKGNIYIGPDVRNVKANIFADCSVFSYGGGGPVYGSGVDQINNTIAGAGLYNWGDSTNMIETLNKQLLIEGSVASFNTVGGADSDEFGYLRNGFGEAFPLPATAAQREESQQYDLNYLRLFKLDLDTDSNGLPRDWSCDRYLTVDDILNIELWNESFGEEGEQVLGENGSECDGIQWTSLADGGDLVPPVGEDALADGLEEDDLNPVYIFFNPAESFLYTK